MPNDLRRDASELKGAFEQLQKAMYEQSSRLMELFTPLGANCLLAETLQGYERVDAGGFALQLTVLADDAHIPLKSLLARPAAVRIETADGRGRLLHGYVTGFDLEGANGGFAKYVLTLEPWLAFLRYRSDSYLFQDKTVFEIVDEIFQAHTAGPVAPRWRWDIADRSVYPRRSITTQYHETDHVFVTRLLAEEGLYYWFEFSDGGDADIPGNHTMVIADHADAWQDNEQAAIPFQRADATEPQDSIQSWQGGRRLQATTLAWHSWDYKQTDRRAHQTVSNHVNTDREIRLSQWDDPGAYAWESTGQAERLQSNAMQAIELRNKLFQGRSTVRALRPGTRFELTRHYEHDLDDAEGRRFAVLAIEHHAHNNFNEDLRQAVWQLFGGADYVAGPQPVEHDYWNTFVAARASIAYRPLTTDEHGLRVHPKPTVRGAQTALVVGGEDGGPVLTDRDHRVKVQFHWQRGSRASMRAPHPDGADNAPASEKLGVWLRVSSAVAGSNWGHVTLPRTGQEVLVEFLHGDIDRPLVTGALYNGEGEENSQGNRVQGGAASATGNAPAWFTGNEAEHAHPAVYSGIKTQALQGSQQGGGGFNQLVFDDTPGQESTQLSTTLSTSRLHVGHQHVQNDNARGQGRGHGAELASEAHGAVRGGAGLLVSADAQSPEQGAFLDSEPVQAVMEQARDVALSLADNAQKQGAGIGQEAAAKDLPALQAQASIQEVVSATQSSGAETVAPSDPASGGVANTVGAQTAIQPTRGGDGTATAYSEPHLQFSAPKGVMWATPSAALLLSGATSSITAGQDINIAAQQQIAIGTEQGVSLYTVGAAAAAGDPLTQTGIRLHAAQGQLKVQSLQGPSKLAAEMKVSIASTGGALNITAPVHTLLAAAGASIKLDGDSIRVHAPGAVKFMAGAHKFVGPQAKSATAAANRGQLKACPEKMQAGAARGEASIG